jgi:HlyD family secretion protein
MATKRKNKVLYILLGLVGVLVVFLIIAKAAGWIGKEEGTKIDAEKAALNTIVEKVSASGRVQPVTEVKISSDVSGEIVELFVKEGDSVVKGQLLLKIRPDNYVSMVDQMMAALNTSKAQEAQARSRLAQVEAQLARAKLEFERQQKLYSQKVISDADFELASTNYQVVKQDQISAEENVDASRFSVESAMARVREAKENLRRTSIYAPMSGTVSKQSVELGERVVGTIQMTGTEMLRIANLNTMEVRVNVNENDIVRVALGDTAEVEVDAYSNSGQLFKGIVTSIANTAKDAVSMDAVTEFEVRIRILNDSYSHLLGTGKARTPFRPGMTASVDVITERKQNILTVPLASVTTRTERQMKEKAGKKGSKDGEGSDLVTVEVSTDGEESNADEKGKPKNSKEDELKEVVFVVSGEARNMVSIREVKTGISDFDRIEIISGLSEGDEVVSGPFLAVSKQLKEGTRIKINQKSEGNKSTATGASKP